MNTLSKSITSNFFQSAEDYGKLKVKWSELMNSEAKHTLGPEFHLLYLVLMGKDWRKAFWFPTNQNKLNNGYKPMIYTAIERLYNHWKILPVFDGIITKDALEEVVRIITHPEADENGCIITDAYYK